MSNFWSDVARGSAPAPAQPRQEPVATQNPWWIPGTPQHHQQQTVEVAPPVEQDYHPRQAQSDRLKDTCPGCGSVNYMRPIGSRSAMRCYDCGYNEHMGMSLVGEGIPADKSTPVHQSRQVSTSNNFNPTTFDPAQGGAGRVG